MKLAAAGRSMVSGAGFIVLAVLVTWANSLDGPFLPDDHTAILTNPRIRGLAESLGSLGRDHETTLAGRPVAALSFAFNYAVGGLEPRGYHLTNVALHALAALLLFGFLREVLPRVANEAAGPAAFTAALIWAVHPLHTEAVNYVVHRTEILSAAFMLTSLWCVVRGASDARPVYSGLAVAACWLAVLSKETAAGLPLLAWSLDAILLSRGWGRALGRRPGLYAGLTASWVWLALVLLGSPRPAAAGWHLGVTAWSYLLTQSGILTHYLRLVLWPRPLSVSYQDWPLAASVWEVGPTFLFWASLVVLTMVAVWRRRPAGLLGVLFFVVLAPTSSIVPIVTELAAEHRMYLPLVSIAVPVGIGVQRLGGRRGRPATAVLALLIALPLGLSTWDRNRDYRTAAGLWQTAVEARPQNPIAHGALGYYLEQEGKLEEAVTAQRTAVRLDPDYVEGWLNLGYALEKLGRDTEARVAFATASRLSHGVPPGTR